jgi:hypothetical protein
LGDVKRSPKIDTFALDPCQRWSDRHTSHRINAYTHAARSQSTHLKTAIACHR